MSDISQYVPLTLALISPLITLGGVIYVAHVTRKTSRAAQDSNEKLAKLKIQTDLLIAERAQRPSLRNVDLETRLAKHQEAFALWDELFSVIHNSEKGNIVQRCYKWWAENNLYLNEEVRHTFREQILYVGQYASVYRGGKDSERIWNGILNVFLLLEQEVSAGAYKVTLSDIALLYPEVSFESK